MANADHDRGRHSQATASPHADTEDALWLALCLAPDEGTDIGELMRITGMKRTKLYRHLREHAKRDAPSRSAVAAGARGPPRSRHRE